jgi:hypothetical protein
MLLLSLLPSVALAAEPVSLKEAHGWREKLKSKMQWVSMPLYVNGEGGMAMYAVERYALKPVPDEQPVPFKERQPIPIADPMPDRLGRSAPHFIPFRATTPRVIFSVTRKQTGNNK